MNAASTGSLRAARAALPATPALPRASEPRLLLSGSTTLTPLGPADPAGAGPVLTEDLAAHRDRLGFRPGGSPALLDVVGGAGLTGHGGGHVPAVLKWRRALRGDGPLTVVANGAESEPVSGKDGTLLRQRPHLVLDGLVVLAEALGADRAVLWLHGDDDGARRAALLAVDERRRQGVDRHVIEVVSGPHHYLAGEGSAITRALAGGPALPTARRPVTDPHAPRTLVHNVETLARLALLARGAADPTTVLLTVVSPTGRHVLEVDRTDTFTDVLARAGWPVAAPPQALLLGGYGGQWAAWAQVRDVAVHEPALRAVGLGLGAGVVVPLAADACGLARTAALVEYLASMSARQCGPCLFGLPSLAGVLAGLAAGRAPAGALERLHALRGAVEGRGACHHPDGVTRLVASAVQVFGADLVAHAAGAPCLAGESEVGR
ncbi:NADH-ubiquinone oxidoreductase-F iron-sulfur binding region domain-containing protein [Cellulomonas soli]|uniref:NADH dehydrogenase n=1 Tax=Cellulomonas soli TaxID=931535 RepID=A0A512PEI8_9CELL|nr:NADH-ubiquinone oxidoreductase-F iron-sulfur binding region domain-containing protein [Cellulomonas soli]NYI58909.1 NADH:ubiquinone oxidoreductase subunit F (NADH-binding) [Cellulomonas soli]GEP69598.1 NADH dehydrogenase [Cellulomonas soli]